MGSKNARIQGKTHRFLYTGTKVHMLLFRRLFPVARAPLLRRYAVALAEHAREIKRIVKTAFQRDRLDALCALLQLDDDLTEPVFGQILLDGHARIALEEG